jgi:hypothetical protein
MLRRKCRRFEAKRAKTDIFSVMISNWDRNGEMDEAGLDATFVDEDHAIAYAKENVPSSGKEGLGIAEVWVGEWVYTDDIEIDPEEGEPYSWNCSILGELQAPIYTVTSANKKTAQAWGLRADEYGSDDVTESRIRCMRRR